MSTLCSVDATANGFLASTASAARYETIEGCDPCESTGFMAEHLAAGSRVLDVGCGTGSLTVALARHTGATLVGVEPHPQRADAARRRGLDVHTGVLDDLDPDQTGHFDTVLFVDVLEHLPTPSDALALAQRFLRPGGEVLISVPNIGHWTVRLNLLRGRFDPSPTGIMDATHLRWFTASVLRSLVERSGLTIVEQRVSAGAWMPVYRCCSPFRQIGHERTMRWVRRLARRFPTLIGCQHLVRAKLGEQPGHR